MTEIAVIEMPMGTTHKYEIDKNDGKLVLDRIIRAPVPYNYGYIPNTLSEDGDPIDVFILSNEPISPLTKVKITLIGVIHCVDNGENDEKLIATIEGDENVFVNVFTDVYHYLVTYKDGIKIDFSRSPLVEVAEELLRDAKARFTK